MRAARLSNRSYISSLPFTTISFSLNLYLTIEVPSFVIISTSLSSSVKGIERGNANTTSIVFPGLPTSIWMALMGPVLRDDRKLTSLRAFAASPGLPPRNIPIGPERTIS